MPLRSKQQARRTVRSLLGSLSEEQYRLGSETIRSALVNLLAGLMSQRTVESILLYEYSAKKREVDVSPLMLFFLDLSFDVVPNSPSAPFPSRRYDSIIVPLLGFNDKGFRLGQGGGWYDKLLATQPEAVKIGVGFDVGNVSFAEEEHDIPLNYLVTDSGIRKLD